MHPQRFALIGGIFMALLGLVAFIPALSSYPTWLPALSLEVSYGLFLNLFAMNVLNKCALIVMGVLGIIVSQARFTELPSSINYSRLVFIVMGALAILGMIPATNTLGSYWPLFGNMVWLNAMFAAVGAYFGFALSSKVKLDDRGLPTHRHHPAHT